MNKRGLIHKLFEIEAIRFGEFTLQSGQVSPIYIDLRRAFSFPKILVAMAEAMRAEMQGPHFDLVCGVPYAAIPLATAISIQHSIPMIMLRKEAKGYGTKQRIEGVYRKGQTVWIIEDVITLGKSVLETAAVLEQEELKIQGIAIFADREQGGMQNIAQAGYRPHAVCSMSQLIADLVEEQLIDSATAAKVYAFIGKHP